MNYKYCPKCSGQLKMQQRESAAHPICQSCGFVFYQNSKPTAATIISNEKGQVLLVKRAINPHFGKWGVVGGFLENGEDPIAGAKREAKEELGVEIEPTDILTIVVDEYGYEKGDFYTLSIFYLGKIVSGEIKLDSENSQFAWFAKDQIPWDEIGFKNDLIALNKLCGR